MKTLLRMEGVRVASDIEEILSDVYLDIQPGEVVGVIGLGIRERDAFTQILSGEISVNEGRIFVAGERVPLQKAPAILHNMTQIMTTECALSDNLSISDNLFVVGRNNAMRHRKGLASQLVYNAKNVKTCKKMMELARIKASPDALVGSLVSEQRERLELLRAILGSAEICVINRWIRNFDTAAGESVLKQIFAYARRCRIAVIIMFSSIEQLMQYSDKAIIFRKGRTVKLQKKQEFDYNVLLRTLAGEKDGDIEKRNDNHADNHPAYEFAGAGTEDGFFHDFSLKIYSGEVLGLLNKSGIWLEDFPDVFRQGVKFCKGRLLHFGEPISNKQIYKQFFSDKRIGLLAGNDNFGVVPKMSIKDNLLLGVSPKVSFGYIGRDLLEFARKACVKSGIVSFELEADGQAWDLPFDKIMRLAYERVLLQHPDICIIYGISAIPEALLCELLKEICAALTARGTAVLILSTQRWVLERLCDRIAIIRDGRVLEVI